jgi:hypothetical protein
MEAGANIMVERARDRLAMGRSTHLLNSCSKQGTVLAEDFLHDDATTVTGPRTFHLGEHPFVGADLFRVMEVDGAIKQSVRKSHLLREPS